MLNNFLEKIKNVVWRLVYSPGYYFRYIRTRRTRNEMNILDSLQTCNYILDNKCSVCRFGDGELQMISHWLDKGNKENFGVDSFQDFDVELSKRLYEVLISQNDNLLVCLPFPFKKASVYSGYDRLFFMREYLSRKGMLDELFQNGKICGDTTFTRFYLHRTDITSFPYYINRLKMIWNSRDILIVEGKYSRLGIGNDLFNNSTSVRRIICPAANAFDCYDKILQIVKANSKDRLVLLALGQTATVLAYDLSVCGIQAVDIGHVDIEYEWYLMGAKEKIPVKNKYVNEVKTGRISTSLCDSRYLEEIICDIS